MVKDLFLKYKKILLVVVVLLFVCILALPYVKAEYYTNKYGKEFEDIYGKEFEALYDLTGMIEKVDLYRIFEYSETSAKMYYAEVGGECTYYLYFSRDNKDSDWTLNTYKVLWSKWGSAEDWPWPFYFKEL